MKTYKTVGTTLKNEIIEYHKGQTIIGIDPGLQNLGIGIIQIDLECNLKTNISKRGKKSIDLKDVAKLIKGYSYCLIKIKQQRTIEQKLFFIFEELSKIIEEHAPKLIMVEDAFVGINKNSALKLGLVRGAILTAIGKYSIPLKVISPKEIKMETTSNGAAQKEDIQKIFAQILPKWPKEIPFDCSDAIAAAFCGIKFLAQHFIEKSE